MRGLFELSNPASPRMDIAVEQLRDGMGFSFDGVWFHREGSALRCDAVSPWAGPGLDDPEAFALIQNARATLDRLASASPSFASAVVGLEPHFAIIDDADTGWMPIVELTDQRLDWKFYRPSSAD